jgi:cell surface protein SprA
LPLDPLNTNNTDPTIWGKIPTNQSLLYAFSDKDAERLSQDVGFDGLNDAEETQLFGTSFGADPANDNYSYFRSTEYDNSNA